MKKYNILFLLLLLIEASCASDPDTANRKVPLIGFADAFEDNTLSKARDGFYDALAKNGFSEKDGTVKILYRNAQASQPALIQIVNYFISEKVDLIATCPTLATIAALQQTKTIPVFMMVAPEPSLMQMVNNGKAPANLFGVGEDLAYIDTSFDLITQLIKPKALQLHVGVIYSQSEPQSLEALRRLQQRADAQQIILDVQAVSNSSETLLASEALLQKNIDVFFAIPDNSVFAAFEAIARKCEQYKVPVITSEAGLVARGAVAAFGADIYQWGYQCGEQAARYLKDKDGSYHWEMVHQRNRVYNPSIAEKNKIVIPPDYVPVP